MHGVVKAAFDEITANNRFYTTENTGRPRLLIMSGLPMSGKSYLSNLISEKMDDNLCVVRTDYIRPIIARHMGRREPIYSREEHTHVFALGHELVKLAIKNGWPTIADATNLTDEFRKWAVDAGRGQADQILVAFMEISHETAMDRNAAQQERSGSTATPAVYALLNYEKEPVEKCSTPHIVINSEVDIKPWAGMLVKWFNHEIDRVMGTVIPRNPK